VSYGRCGGESDRPPDSFDPSEPGIAKKFHGGGSLRAVGQFCSTGVV
jgi:hypothetical protein